MVIEYITNFFNYVEIMPQPYRNIFTVAIYIALIVIYSVFIWFVYREISKKDIISLNLAQYNNIEHATLNKLYAGFLYFIEYIVILPFLILFWYILFALVLLFFSQNQTLENILLLSAAVVGAIRLLAYYNGEISRELSKLLPFTILAITLLSQNILDVGRFAGAIERINELVSSVGYSLLFIAALELVLRFLDLFKTIIVDANK